MEWGNCSPDVADGVPLSVKAWSPLSWILLKSSPPSMLQKQPAVTITNAQGLKTQQLLAL